MKLWLHKYACYQNKLAVYGYPEPLCLLNASLFICCAQMWLHYDCEATLRLQFAKKKKKLNVFTFCLCGLYCADILQTLFTARFWQAHLNLGMEEACWDWWRLDPLELLDPSIFVAVICCRHRSPPQSQPLLPPAAWDGKWLCTGCSSRPGPILSI